MEGIGTLFKADPTKKWPGVRTSYDVRSSLKGAIGRELRHASTLHKRVVNSSAVGVEAFRILLRWCFTLFTPASQGPPKCGAKGVKNFHET